MTKRTKDYIPHDIAEAAKGAGLGTPSWYVGRSNGHEGKPVGQSAHDMVKAARESLKTPDAQRCDAQAGDKPQR